MTPCSLEPSKAIHALIGEYETEWIFDVARCDIPTCNCGKDHIERVRRVDMIPHAVFYPSPTFAELIRVLPRIGEKKGWKRHGTALKSTGICSYDLVDIYQDAPNESEAMKACEDYLMKLL
jgi:hypothetical protein